VRGLYLLTILQFLSLSRCRHGVVGVNVVGKYLYFFFVTRLIGDDNMNYHIHTSAEDGNNRDIICFSFVPNHLC
jgi:hypothetical protein